MSTDSSELTDVASTESPEDTPRVAVDLVGGLAVLAIAAVFLINAGEGSLNWIFPVSLSCTAGAVAIYLVIRGLLGTGEKMAVVPPVVRGEGVDVVVFTVAAVAYVVLARPVGFWITSAAMLFALAVYLDPVRSKRNVALAAVVAVSVCIVASILFARIFWVPLPPARWLPF